MDLWLFMLFQLMGVPWGLADYGTSILYGLDDLEAPSMEACNRGVKLSSITIKLKDTIGIRPLLGRFQQLGLLKIVYNPSVDDEPLVQITEKGKLQIMEMLLSLQPSRK